MTRRMNLIYILTMSSIVVEQRKHWALRAHQLHILLLLVVAPNLTYYHMSLMKLHIVLLLSKVSLVGSLKKQMIRNLLSVRDEVVPANHSRCFQMVDW